MIKDIAIIHPLKLIFCGIFLVSIGINILQHERIQKLDDQLDKKPCIKIIFVPIPMENNSFRFVRGRKGFDYNL